LDIFYDWFRLSNGQDIFETQLAKRSDGNQNSQNSFKRNFKEENYFDLFLAFWNVFKCECLNFSNGNLLWFSELQLILIHGKNHFLWHPKNFWIFFSLLRLTKILFFWNSKILNLNKKKLDFFLWLSHCLHHLSNYKFKIFFSRISRFLKKNSLKKLLKSSNKLMRQFKLFFFSK